MFFLHFADDAVDNLNFPPRNISKQSVKIITKLQFFFIRLKKMLNLLSEWDKMAKRSSNLKEKVHSLCENIYAITNLTEKSTASCAYCDKTNKSSRCRTKVSFFVVGKSERVKNLWQYETKFQWVLMKPYRLFSESNFSWIEH